MSRSAWPLQVAVYGRLSAALAPVPVYDAVPAASPFPYVSIGDQTAADNADKTDRAAERVTITLHVWSRKSGRKEVKELAAKVVAALHDYPLTVAGFAPVTLTHEFSNDFYDPDGITLHGVLRFGATITPP
jgi:Protein of unknown function (DUF3168)